jgi:hypothetical protein
MVRSGLPHAVPIALACRDACHRHFVSAFSIFDTVSALSTIPEPLSTIHAPSLAVV